MVLQQRDLTFRAATYKPSGTEGFKVFQVNVPCLLPPKTFKNNDVFMERETKKCPKMAQVCKSLIVHYRNLLV